MGREKRKSEQIYCYWPGTARLTENLMKDWQTDGRGKGSPGAIIVSSIATSAP